MFLTRFRNVCAVSVRRMADMARTQSNVNEEDVIFKEHNDKGVIILNRPKALNALNLSMVRKIYPVLQKWENEKMLVLIKGSGDRSFCSGGDVRAVVQAGLKGEKLGHDFFRREYILNGLIGTYNKPYIAFIDGIVMGGGVGLSVHGHYRVATERTMFAMPETAIGLFPDVGGSYFLPRLGGKLGYYLALTGHRLKGVDVLKAGIATHYCDSNQLKNLENALLGCSSSQKVKVILDEMCPKDSREFSLAPHLDKINKCFDASTVEGILQNLEADHSQWSNSTLDIMKKMSPTSLKISLKELQLGANMDLQDCLKMEYRIAVGCLANKDFYEGVRAQLIDKDLTPVWNPSTLEEVSKTMVENYFNRLPDEEELKHKL